MKEQNHTIWVIDPGHSSIQFKVKHLGIANILGSFSMFQGEASTPAEDFSGAAITFSIDTESLSTNNKDRDIHLKGDMFFKAPDYPQITFTGLLEKSAAAYSLNGELTIRGITKTIRLDAELTGMGIGRWGDTRAAFELSGELNRKDFDMHLEILTGTGSLVVGEKVKLQIAVELIKQEHPA